MTSFNELVEDYSRHQVPDEKTVGGIHIGIIVIGVGITITAFLLGSQMGLTLGFWNSLYAFYLGGLLLAIVSGFTGAVGASTRLSTAMIIKNTFGESGAIFVNLILTLVMLGWCTVLAAFFGDALLAGLETNWQFAAFSRESYVALGSAIMALITIFGFKALDKQSLIMVPMMLVFLLVILIWALKQANFATIISTTPSNGPDMGLGAATSIVVGSFIVGATCFSGRVSLRAQRKTGCHRVINRILGRLPAHIDFVRHPKHRDGRNGSDESRSNARIRFPRVFLSRVRFFDNRHFSNL